MIQQQSPELRQRLQAAHDANIAAWGPRLRDPNEPRQWPWMLFQFAISIIVGGWVLVHPAEGFEKTSASLTWGLILGFLAARAAMFCIAWARFGWKAARSMRMS